MDKETNRINEDDLSLSQSVEIDKIIDFYKDKELPSETLPEEEAQEPATVLDKLMGFLRKDTDADNTGIRTKTYGLSERGRIILYRSISAAISLLIILGSFVLAYYLPSNQSVIAKKQAELRNSEEYKSLKSRYDTLKTEVKNLKTSNKTKKEKTEQIKDIDNTKAELRTEITNKSYELNELNIKIKEQRDIIAGLDAEISQKAASETVLPPGRYVTGKNIAQGKYTVTGTGKFMLSSASGKSKVNTTLGSTPLEVTLTIGDILKFDSKVRFVADN